MSDENAIANLRVNVIGCLREVPDFWARKAEKDVEQAASDLARLRADNERLRAERDEEVAEAERRGIERCVDIVEPKPGPWPRDFQDHRVRLQVRRWLTDCLRALLDKPEARDGE